MISSPRTSDLNPWCATEIFFYIKAYITLYKSDIDWSTERHS